MEIARGERIRGRDLVINLQKTAVGGLLAAIVHDERAREAERGIQIQNIESQLIRRNALRLNQSRRRLNLRRSRRVAIQRCAQPEPAAVVPGKEKSAIPAVVKMRYRDRATHRS